MTTMNIEKLLQSGLINLAELSRRLWPHLDDVTARTKLYRKIQNQNRQRLTEKDFKAISEVLKEFE